MGQYYKPVVLNEKNQPVLHFSCYDFGNGAKLMEHSWVGNDFVGFVEIYLANSPQRIVWAGDYADEESGEVETIYEKASRHGYRLSHGQDDVIDKYSHNFGYGKAAKRLKYLINYTKNQYVIKPNVPKEDGWQINPLPLLTCEVNGRGGGDFRGRDQKNLIGSWSRDLIGLSSRKQDIPKGAECINFNLIE